MKAFDFDNTLYRGESSLDFSLYMIRTHKKIFLYLPIIMANTISYKLCLVDKDKLGAEICKYMKLIIRDNAEARDIGGEDEMLASMREYVAERVAMTTDRRLFLPNGHENRQVFYI